MQYYILLAAAVAVSGTIGYLIGDAFGFDRGRDVQRVDDILAQWKGGWRRLPKRGERWRFTKTEIKTT